MSLKKWYRKFRQWQREPMHYKPLTNESHVCLNCGQEFVGRFCTRCGQESTVERKAGWVSLRWDLLNTLDLEIRELARTFIYLFLRPGYLINDYLSGKRKVCTPPANTLIMVSMANVLLRNLTSDKPKQIVHSSLRMSAEGRAFFESMTEWTRDNKGWHYLLLSLFLTIPTWVLFRHSPRHPRHTMVEGFFIQVFMFMLILLIEILLMILGQQPEKWTSFVMPIYYMFALGPIFGYNWWSTLWRSVAVFVTSSMLVMMVPLSISAALDLQSFSAVVVILALFLTICSVILAVGYLIGRWTEKRRMENAEISTIPPIDTISPMGPVSSIIPQEEKDNDKPNPSSALREEGTGAAKKVLRKSSKRGRHRASRKHR